MLALGYPLATSDPLFLKMKGMQMKRHLTRILGILVLISILGIENLYAEPLVVLTGCQNPGFCTLAELKNGGTIRIDDKIFEEWNNVDPDNIIDLTNVRVIPLGEGTGLRFESGGLEPDGVFTPGTSEFIAHTGELLLTKFEYNVRNVFGKATIAGASLSLLAIGLVEDDINVAKITETVSQTLPDTLPIATQFVVVSLGPPLINIRAANADFPPIFALTIATQTIDRVKSLDLTRGFHRFPNQAHYCC